MEPVPDAEVVRRWCRAALEAMALAREEVDALNVYPVPDGDTGTNLYLTLEAVAEAVQDCEPDAALPQVAEAISRSALRGARGNSGIILAQMLRGVAAVLSTPGVTLADGRALADGLVRAADEAERAVAEPVEGTMLTVARAAGTAARRQAESPGAALADVAAAAASSARDALEHTPDQLDVLRAAGVVDAGGRGLTVLLDAFDTVVTGRRALPAPRRVGTHQVPAPAAAGACPASSGASVAGPAFEVMYLLDAPDDRIPVLRASLAEAGDSLVMVGGDGEWHVHVHVDDAGAAVEAGVRAGTPSRISVTSLHPAGPGQSGEPAGRVLVASAAGSGLAELFATAGATVVSTAAGHRPTTAEVLTAVDRGGAGDVVILPNERDALPAAQAAAADVRAGGRRVAVIPTVAQVQGLAALAVHEPARPFDADVVEMTTAAGHTRHGAVTVATREAVTMAGVCRPGDVLGVVDGDFAVVGDGLLEVAAEVLRRMLAAGGELVTVVTGADAADDLAAGVETAVRKAHPEVDTVVYDGGQPRYPLLLGVE
ncbi:hypothetical protein CLV30_10352 [Haloactinopolyspora alba]|uniref:DhaL domain-containing protein n=1 Tax=Haloactinopolyspora alba TaxID=648780 RepID=A0A2P8E8V6_9ACTN|nr:hypothetical protein CLV30_10352 [Haloactinopolyspora alba]